MTDNTLQRRLTALAFAATNIRRQAEQTRQYADEAKLLIKQRQRIRASANEADEIANVLEQLAMEVVKLEPQPVGPALTDDAITLHYGEHFFCTPEHAVSEAYLLSCAEAAIQRQPRSKYEIGHMLANYCDGDVTIDQALTFMNEDLDDQILIQPGSDEEPKQ